MISKESMSQHVYTIEMFLATTGNKLDEIKKYFDNVMKICQLRNIKYFKGRVNKNSKENLSL